MVRNGASGSGSSPYFSESLKIYINQCSFLEAAKSGESGESGILFYENRQSILNSCYFRHHVATVLYELLLVRNARAYVIYCSFFPKLNTTATASIVRASQTNLETLAYCLFLPVTKNAISFNRSMSTMTRNKILGDTGSLKGVDAFMSNIVSNFDTITNQNIAFYATDNSHIDVNSQTLLSGNSADYSPATSGIDGNNNSQIVQP
jgi:hypothetical protein